MNRPHIATTALITALLVAELPGSATAEDVKVGALMGMPSPLANFVPPILNAAKLAEADINAGGGIL